MDDPHNGFIHPNVGRIPTIKRLDQLFAAVPSLPSPLFLFSFPPHVSTSPKSSAAADPLRDVKRESFMRCPLRRISCADSLNMNVSPFSPLTLSPPYLDCLVSLRFRAFPPFCWSPSLLLFSRRCAREHSFLPAPCSYVVPHFSFPPSP